MVNTTTGEIVLDRFNFEELVSFIDELRKEGFNIGISQYLAVQDLMLSLAAIGKGIGSVHKLGNLIGPILCSKPSEQDIFLIRFNDWIKLKGLTERKGLAEKIIDTRSEKTQYLENELKKYPKWKKYTERVFKKLCHEV
ncbi:MAG: hypothetical protein HQK94_05530 [Nitrospirae bacterium]|nr:hypothetical protein [Nitrospirota bacterium]